VPSYLRGGIALLTLAGLLAFAGSAFASPSSVVGHVYVDGNTSGANTIIGYDRHADGTLSPIPGSPFVAGGAGTGSSIPSQGAIQVSSDGRYALAVDAGSNQVSVLRIRQDGALRLVSGGVVSSNGSDPVSLAEHNGLVYVANAGSADSNYTGFLLTSAGHLLSLPGSTIALPSSAQPGDVLFNSNGTNLVGAEVGTSQIDSFRVRGDGRLAPAPGSPFPAQGPGPFGSEFNPTHPRQLFVSNAHGGTGAGTVSAFKVAGDGQLSSIGASPFKDNQTAPCWVEITHDGRFLFTVNTGSANISSYAVGPDGALSLVGSTPAGGLGAASEDARLSTDGRDLYVNETGASVIGEFAVNGATLTAVGSVPVPTGAGAAGLATN
jgi:6-phosphogluconolactonase (cycloisomerase 2 family)